MDEYLPQVYTAFNERFPRIAGAQGELARAVDETSPFDERTTRLLKLALAIGAQADGAVRSNVRKGVDLGGHGGRAAGRGTSRDHHVRLPDSRCRPGLGR